MLRKKPKVPLPDFGDKPIGVWIMEQEKKGLFGHFKDNSLFFFDDSKGNRVYSTMLRNAEIILCHSKSH